MCVHVRAHVSVYSTLLLSATAPFLSVHSAANPCLQQSPPLSLSLRLFPPHPSLIVHRHVHALWQCFPRFTLSPHPIFCTPFSFSLLVLHVSVSLHTPHTHTSKFPTLSFDAT